MVLGGPVFQNSISIDDLIFTLNPFSGSLIDFVYDYSSEKFFKKEDCRDINT